MRGAWRAGSLKRMVLATVVAVGATVAWHAVARQSGVAQSAVPAVRIAGQSAMVASGTALAAPNSTPSEVPRTEPLHPTDRRPVTSSARRAMPQPPVVQDAPPPPLSAEVAIVQRVARSLVSGNAQQALALLDEYGRDYPHGLLKQEANALRVQALAGSGRTAEAKVLARELLDAHPRGVLAARLRSVLAAGTSTASSDAGPR